MNNRPAANRERGGSLIATLFWLVVIGFVAWNGFLVARYHYMNWQVQDVFSSLVSNMDGQSPDAVREKMEKSMGLKYMDAADLPEQFYDELSIDYVDGRLEISSEYRCTVWPLGRVELGEDETATGFDALRLKARIDIDFAPYAYAGTAE